MDEGSSDEEVLTPQQQEVVWKIEAAIIRIMNAEQAVAPNELVAKTRAAWQSLNRPEQVDDALIQRRIDVLVRREWFELVNGKFTLTELTTKGGK